MAHSFRWAWYSWGNSPNGYHFLGTVFLAAAMTILHVGATFGENEADPETAAIIKDLQGENPGKRDAAAKAAEDLPSKGQPVLDALTAALIKEDVPENKIDLIHAISTFGAVATRSLWVIGKQLDAKETIEAAATAIALIGQDAPNSLELAKLVPRLMKLLEQSDANVKIAAIFTLQKIGPAALSAVPSLVKTTGDANPKVRWVSLATLAVLKANGEEVTNADARRLTDDPDKEVRSAAAFFMSELQAGAPKTAARALVLGLQDQDLDVVNAIVVAFGDLQPEGLQVAIPLLNEIIRGGKSTIAKQAAITALGYIGKPAEGSVPDLLYVLANGTPSESHAAALALARISSATNVVDALLGATRDARSTVRAAAASALGSIGPIVSARSVPALVTLARDAIEDVRVAAAASLGSLGASAKSALPVLITGINDKDNVKKASAQSLANIANSVRDAGDIGALPTLRTVLDALKPHKDVKVEADTVRRAIEYLELTWRAQLSEALKRFSTTYQTYIIVTAAMAAWVFLCTLLYMLRPIVLLRLNEALRPLDVSLPSWLGNGKIPLRSLTLISFFGARPRTLDAWVHRNIEYARKQYEKIPSVNERRVHVDLPVIIKGTTYPSLTPQDLRPTLQAGVTCIFITGEGGSGKTSLAAALGRRAMEAAAGERLASHVMIPIWIEDDLLSQAETKDDQLVEIIRRNLQLLIGTSEIPPADLVKKLLAHKRLFVIIDRLSELSETTRDSVRPSSPAFLPNCVVITSRWKEDFGNIDVAEVEPLRVAGNRLSSFMEAYLTRCQKRSLFTDSEFFAACGRLSEIVQDRTVTVLFAKLFADEVVRQKESGSSSAEIRSLPHLIASYINHLNDTIGERRLETAIVHKCAKIVAWKCIESRLAPAEAKVDDVLEALGEDAKRQLDYLEKRLRLVRLVEPQFTSIRFLLDPLAEYLAASYIVDYGRSDRKFWVNMMRRLKGVSDPTMYRGFVNALYWSFKDAVEDDVMPMSVFNEIDLLRRQTEGEVPSGSTLANTWSIQTVG